MLDYDGGGSLDTSEFCEGVLKASTSEKPLELTRLVKQCSDILRLCRNMYVNQKQKTAGASEGLSATSAQACCELCYEKASCLAASYRSSTEEFSRSLTCDLKEGADYIAARGSTVKDVHSTEQCCALCATWEDCKVGIWDSHWHECYLKAGFVSERQSSNPIVACVARGKIEAPEEMDFDTYVLVAYSTAGGRSAGNMAAGYWVQGITEEQEAEEELQFYEAAAFFLETYPHKTFVFTNCEGDWEIRGGLGVQRAPHEAAFASMARWLQARQAGVTRARQRHRMPGAAGNVYLAGEVNLVAESLFEGKPNVVNRVLPFVQLDMARALLAPDGEPSLIGPCPDAIDLFRRPLALWSFEPGSATNLDIEPLEETLCVALFTKKLREDPEILETVLREIDVQGLTLVGLRLVIPDLVSASAAVPVSLKAAVKPHEEALLLALRGPHALALWRVMLGPSDPVLARQTDPQSLNAKFGGENRSEALAFAPPSSLGKAAADVAWAFGGRIEAEEAILPKEPLHGMQVAAPKTLR
eukprot:g4970.t1